MNSILYPTRQVLTVLGIGLILILISYFTLDQSLSQYFKLPELTSVWLFARNITNVGLGEHYFILAAVLYVFGKWIQPQFEKTRIWGRNLFFSLIVSGVFVMLIKFCVGRQRPHKSADFDHTVFNPFTTHWDFHSFASGHTQVMFTMATMLAVTFPKARWVFFAIAAFFGFTRVVVHDHYLSDVIGGAMVGYIGTLTALYWVARREHRSLQQSGKVATLNS